MHVNAYASNMYPIQAKYVHLAQRSLLAKWYRSLLTAYSDTQGQGYWCETVYRLVSLVCCTDRSDTHILCISAKCQQCQRRRHNMKTQTAI